jgi:hypothetical protein
MTAIGNIYGCGYTEDMVLSTPPINRYHFQKA